ncbi:MAG: NUDIX domain-containing protein [Chthoniobacterales bacterium]|nr:NUDIX domain-containing protein [Chthoniobacterales bacterium]
MTSQEKVLVVPRSLFDSLGAFQGLNSEVERYLPVFLDPANHSFVPRSEAEEDPSLKQLIPYIIVTCRDRVLQYRRGSGSGETRLLKKRSLGIGGHINDEDGLGKDFDAAAYERALLRELEEELNLPASFHFTQIKPLALLNDDSNPVGEVHLGVVHQCELLSDEVTAKEEAIAELGFFSHEELQQRIEEFESWSQIVVRGWKELQP